MPRAPRLQFEGATYHVFHRGNRRERIFWSDQDYARFEAIMLEATNWSGVQLFSWSLMPNHFHMGVTTPEGNLSEFMQRLLTRYAKFFNRLHHFVGHVFQGRYGSILCDKEAYFLELLRYIELNPYRTLGKPLAKLGQWKWSSRRYLMMPESQWPEGLQVPFRDILGRFSANPAQARKNYAQFLADGLKQGNWEEFYKAKESRFLGSETFVQRIKTKAEEPTDPRPAIRQVSLAEFVAKVEALSGISAKDFAGASRKKTLNAWRKAFIRVGRGLLRLSVKDLARYLGRDATAVSQVLRRQAGEEQDAQEIKTLVEGLQR